MSWKNILKNKEEEELSKMINTMNSNDEILASDCSYGQAYFEFSGDKMIDYLSIRRKEKFKNVVQCLKISN